VVCRSESKPNGTKFYQAYQIIIVKVEIIQWEVKYITFSIKI
jgi:hypothetical protein